VSSITAISDGPEWEAYCVQLLWRRHKDDLQPIPAERKGDLGLEAFTRSGGVAFQCYFPIEPLPAKARYEKQRDKLTEDLGKLEKNASELASYLGQTKLTHYWLLVPLFDWPDLLAHCEKRAAILREAALVIINPNFHVGVQTDAAYKLERAELIDGLAPLDLGVPEITEEEKVNWAEAEDNISLVGDLERKLRSIGLENDGQASLREEMLSHYLASDDMLSRVRGEAPDVWHRLDNRIRARERLLATEKLLTDAAPVARLKSTYQGLADDLQKEAPRLTRGDAEAIALGVAASWLLQCPLEF
jgi:hypothetical protein